MSLVRIETPEGVEYDDDLTHRAAVMLDKEWKFSLPALDNWIEERCEADDRPRILEFRRWLIEAVLAGESRVVMPWALYLTTLIEHDIDNSVMEPHVIFGIASREAKSLAASAPRKLDEDQVQKIRDRYLERVRNGTKYGAVKDLKGEYGVTEATIHRVLGTVKPKRIRT